MLAKRSIAAICLSALIAGCSVARRWEGESPNELNLAFQVHQGIPIVVAMINNRPARLIISTGRPRSALSTEFMRTLGNPKSVTILLGSRVSTTLQPQTVDLGGLADGLIGVDLLRTETVTLDFRRRLLILSRARVSRGHRFRGLPSVPIELDGSRARAEIDSAFPDVLISNNRPNGRGNARVTIARIPLGSVPVSYRPLTTSIVGSGALQRLMVTIDYPLGRVLVEAY